MASSTVPSGAAPSGVPLPSDASAAPSSRVAPVGSSVEARCVGRPRSAATEQAILDATLALLVEEGFGGMSIERVAARAGVGKAAIYRRWSSKAEVVVEALRRHSASAIPMVDTGDLRADLLAMLRGIRAAMSGEDGPIMTAFVAEKARYPELRSEYDRAFVSERRAHLHRIISAAVDRGELPRDTDVELVAEAGPAILAHRLMVDGRNLPNDLPDRIVQMLLADRNPR